MPWSLQARPLSFDTLVKNSDSDEVSSLQKYFKKHLETIHNTPSYTYNTLSMSNTPSQVSSLHTYFNKYLVSVEQLNRFFGNNSSQQAEDSPQVKKGVEEVLL